MIEGCPMTPGITERIHHFLGTRPGQTHGPPSDCPSLPYYLLGPISALGASHLQCKFRVLPYRVFDQVLGAGSTSHVAPTHSSNCAPSVTLPLGWWWGGSQVCEGAMVYTERCAFAVGNPAHSHRFQ